MRREDLANGVLVAVIVALLLFVVAILPPVFFPFSLLAVGLIGATVVFAALFLPWRPVARSPLPPQSLQRHLVFQLRREGFRVEEASEGTTVRLGSVSAVRFRVRPARGGSEVSYQTYATPSGWGTLITLIVLFWTSLLSVAAIAYVAWRARRFARDRLGALVTAVDSLPPPPADDIRVLLVHGLSEGHRIASDAYEAQRSAYGDTIAVLAVAGILFWVLALLGLFFALPPAGFWRDWPTLLGLSAAIAVAVTVGLGLLVRSRVRPRLLQLRDWAERLRSALERETDRQPPAEAATSSVELLIGLSEQIPSWLRMRKWAGLSGDQAAGWVVFLVSFGAFMALWFAVDLAIAGGYLYALVAGVLGAGLAVASYVYWTRWREKQEEAVGRILDEWRQRAESLRSRMDRFLQDL